MLLLLLLLRGRGRAWRCTILALGRAVLLRWGRCAILTTRGRSVAPYATAAIVMLLRGRLLAKRRRTGGRLVAAILTRRGGGAVRLLGRAPLLLLLWRRLAVPLLLVGRKLAVLLRWCTVLLLGRWCTPLIRRWRSLVLIIVVIIPHTRNDEIESGVAMCEDMHRCVNGIFMVMCRWVKCLKLYIGCTALRML